MTFCQFWKSYSSTGTGTGTADREYLTNDKTFNADSNLEPNNWGALKCYAFEITTEITGENLRIASQFVVWCYRYWFNNNYYAISIGVVILPR